MKTIVASGPRLLQRISHSLHHRQVCFVALPVGESFLGASKHEGPATIPAEPIADVLGGHFVCLLDWRRRRGVGYDFLCGNSWGAYWGDRGTAWLSPDLVEQTVGAWYLERITT